MCFWFVTRNYENSVEFVCSAYLFNLLCYCSNHLLMSFLLAENDLDVALCGTLHVVPVLSRNLRFVDNTFLPSRWRFHV